MHWIKWIFKKFKMGKLAWEDFYHKMVRAPHNQFKSLEHLNALYFQQLITLYLQNHRLSILIFELRTENNYKIGKCLIHFQGLAKQHSTCPLLCFKRQFHAIPDLFYLIKTIPFDKQVSSHGQHKRQKSYLIDLAKNFQIIQDDSCGLYIFLWKV